MSTEDEIWLVTFVALAVFMAFIAIVTVAGVNGIQKKNNASPLMKKRGTVVDKQAISPNSVLFAETSVLFALDDGSRIRLRIPGQSNLVEGDTGILTWQGNAFRSFELDREKQNVQSSSTDSC